MADDKTNAKLHSLANQIWTYRDQLAKLRKRRTEIHERLQALIQCGPTVLTPEQSFRRLLNLWRAEYRMTDDLISEINANEGIAMAAYNKILRQA